MDSSFVDIAINLLDGRYRGFVRGKQVYEDDTDEVLERARAANVRALLITVTSLGELGDAVNLARRTTGFEGVGVTLGVHPTSSREFLTDIGTDKEHQLDKAIALFKHAAERCGDCIKAFGEFGLDYDRLKFCSADEQKLAFRIQLRVWKSSFAHLPFFLHSRSSTEDLIQILDEEVGMAQVRGVVHSFTDSDRDLERILRVSKLHIGVNGASLRSVDQLSNVKKVPLKRLHLETDGPWCDIRRTHASFSFIKSFAADTAKNEKVKTKKVSLKGRSEPRDIRQVAEVVHSQRDEKISFMEFCDVVKNNSMSLFFP